MRSEFGSTSWPACLAEHCCGSSQVLAVYDATVNASHHDPMPACEPTDRWAPLARLRTGLKAALEVGGTAPASCGCALPIERLNPFIVAVCEERRMLMSATSSSELEARHPLTALSPTVPPRVRTISRLLSSVASRGALPTQTRDGNW